MLGIAALRPRYRDSAIGARLCRDDEAFSLWQSSSDRLRGACADAHAHWKLYRRAAVTSDDPPMSKAGHGRRHHRLRGTASACRRHDRQFGLVPPDVPPITRQSRGLANRASFPSSSRAGVAESGLRTRLCESRGKGRASTLSSDWRWRVRFAPLLDITPGTRSMQAACGRPVRLTADCRAGKTRCVKSIYSGTGSHCTNLRIDEIPDSPRTCKQVRLERELPEAGAAAAARDRTPSRAEPKAVARFRNDSHRWRSRAARPSRSTE